MREGGPDDVPTTRDHEITVVLLAYNCAHRIVPIVERLLALQLPIVAVDNGSRDDTASVLASFEQVELVRLPENIGAAGRDAGVERVHTPYVLFCDDGWYEADGLPVVCDLFDRHPNLALINAKILVGDEQRLDPISHEMAESPVPDRHGLPGAVLLSFMAGAVAVRTVAYKEVGGYDPRFFIGGEEERCPSSSPRPTTRCATFPTWSCTTTRVSRTRATFAPTGCATPWSTDGSIDRRAVPCAGRCSRSRTPRRTSTSFAERR